jgi:hypothetical protein
MNLSKEHLQLVFLVLYVAYQVYAWWAKRQRAPTEVEPEREAEPSPTPVPERPARDPGGPELLVRLDTMRTRAAELQRELVSVRARLAALEGPVVVLRRVLETRVHAPLVELSGRLERLRILAQTTNAPTRILEELDRDDPRDTLARIGQRLYVVATLTETRATPAARRLIEDADAAADDLIDPLRRLAQTQGLTTFDERPVCVQTEPTYEAVVLGLLPEHPIVFVPPDFGGNVYRWASLPHEIAHVLWNRWPGFAVEARQAFGLNRRPRLPGIDREGRLQGRVEDALSGWLEEMHADAFAVLTLGPAAARGLVECFSSPEEPLATTTAYTLDGQHFAPHPPSALRVAWVSRLLERQGFPVEARWVQDTWNKRHGTPEAIIVPLSRGDAVSIEFSVFQEAGDRVLDLWLDHGWKVFGGLGLREVPGLELGAGEWVLARQAASQLLAGIAQHHPPRRLLAAAIEAHTRDPRSTARIAATLHASIQGLESDERRAADPQYASKTSTLDGLPTREDLVAALVFREVFMRRGGARPTGRMG